jgi:hypothetical protein
MNNQLFNPQYLSSFFPQNIILQLIQARRETDLNFLLKYLTSIVTIRFVSLYINFRDLNTINVRGYGWQEDDKNVCIIFRI